MFKTLLIGAGQLGSRHLQGLLKFQKKQFIYVLDKSEDSLTIAKERAAEIEFEHRVNYVCEWESIPVELDLVIVATGASVRAKLVTKLLKSYNVKNLVLEKVLFQDLKSYSEIGDLIKATGTPTWVNHPRRMFEHYEVIKNKIAKSGESVRYQVFGGNWDLACNALHFIDLISFLSGSELLNLDFGEIDNDIIKSKRPNCIELTGSFSGILKNGNRFNITSLKGAYEDITITILTKSSRWIVQEGSAQKIIYFGNENNFNEIIDSFTNEYQSTLTTRIINDILIKGNSRLPNYDEASISHIPFIKGTLESYNKISESNTLICPIT
jgi:predicted dehydrogenase